MSKNLAEGKDFYYSAEGDLVFTKEFLLARGHCCQSGCLHCPYDYRDKVDPSVPQELQMENDSGLTFWEGEIPPDEELP